MNSKNIRLVLISTSLVLDVATIFIPRGHPLKRPLLLVASATAFVHYGLRLAADLTE